MLIHWIWLATRRHITRRQQLQLLEHFSDPEELYRCDSYASQLQLSAQMLDALEDKDLTEARSILKCCSDRRVNILTISDAAYPSRLRNISDPPVVLYYRGTLPDFEGQPVVGVVGTRKASVYGMQNAAQMAGQITACGGIVVSGGAAGIDTAALEGAVEAGGTPVAVLGCGADVVYPKSNRKLFDKIAQTGCILSEYLPGTAPAPWQFPERNRIISGLSDGILVVEAPERSGALITAREAMEQGREVFAVPGNINVASCAGSNGLLREGAGAVLTGWDVLSGFASRYPHVAQREFIPRQMQPEQGEPNTKSDKKVIDNPIATPYSDSKSPKVELDDISRQVLACVGTSPTAVDDVIAQLDMPATQVMQVLTKLALLGVVENHPGRLVSAKL